MSAWHDLLISTSNTRSSSDFGVSCTHWVGSQKRAPQREIIPGGATNPQPEMKLNTESAKTNEKKLFFSFCPYLVGHTCIVMFGFISAKPHDKVHIYVRFQIAKACVANYKYPDANKMEG